jgi:hypothetical protein
MKKKLNLLKDSNLMYSKKVEPTEIKYSRKKFKKKRELKLKKMLIRQP